MKLVWDPNAWEDYLWWQAQDRRVLKRINQLIQDVIRNGNEGIGKPYRTGRDPGDHKGLVSFHGTRTPSAMIFLQNDATPHHLLGLAPFVEAVA